MKSDQQAFTATLAGCRKELLARRNDQGHWTGFLSTSALSTATSVCALALHDPEQHHELICKGLDWIANNVNSDGGWGDTIISKTNINTTSLCYAALAFAPVVGRSYPEVVAGCETWLTEACGGTFTPDQLIETILAFYGKDRTFSTPILTLLTLSGRLGSDRAAVFAKVPQLPFELAAFPRSWFKFLKLQVVSYALPALIAIGQNRHAHRPTRNPIMRWFRNRCKKRTLRLMQHIQPENGGFLEAIPLTCFVAANMCGMGQHQHVVVKKCISFIYDLARDDGGWPIDTNLATWITTLSVQALSLGQEPAAIMDVDHIRRWLIEQQFQEVHPFTDTPPGGISWTALPGAVPDADDTPGAMLALHRLGPHEPNVVETANKASQWLLGLQNSDGGIPTFCKGWGALPFDQSAADISSHTLAAWLTWLPDLPARTQTRIRAAIPRLLAYLRRTQHTDGYWVPLWFGNEHAPDDINPTYGTSRCLIALAKCELDETEMLSRALRWLLQAQQDSGGWSGVGKGETSLEETALAVDALVSMQPQIERQMTDEIDLLAVERAISNGTDYLIAQTKLGQEFPPHPIGFYFAKLWYYESTYPLVFTCQALEKVALAKGVNTGTAE